MTCRGGACSAPTSSIARILHVLVEATRPQAQRRLGPFCFLGGSDESRKGHKRSRRSQACRRACLEGGGRLRSPLVRRHRGAAEELRDHHRGAGGGARGRHGLRRLVDHRLQPDRGVGHDRDPRSAHVPGDAVEDGRAQGREDDLRRRDAGWQAVRGRSALRPQAGARADADDGLRHVQRRPGARVLLLQG